jgi:peptide/nickel transport system substrate-binding protein
LRRIHPLVVLALVLSACGGEASGPAPATPEVPTNAEAPPARGGTLRVGLVAWAGAEEMRAVALDPQTDYYHTSFELFRCCLLRTLMSYSGQPTAEGGAELRPDLAAGPPQVSPDGLRWTFRLKPGLRYSPPHDDREIVTADIVRAVERTVRLGGDVYSFYYVPLIEGTTAFEEGKAETITGLETPDDYTLIVHLTEPVGDLGERFALPATAPIPPGADGNKQVLVASGPYMLEDYTPGSSIALARNPSWDAATDDLREAYADRIELTIGLGTEEAYGQVEAATLDLVLDAPAPPELAERYQSDAVLEDRLLVFPVDVVAFAAMNLAAPPFDDVHVRRAVNLATDKRRLVELWGGSLAARAATHVAPDSLEANLLVDYDAYKTPGEAGDSEAARAEMAKSRYDRDGDGRCDDASCDGVTALALSEEPLARIATPLVEDLEQIGITLELEELAADPFSERLDSGKVPFATNYGWAKDLPNGSAWFSPLFVGSNPGSVNPFLVGASPEELADLGYETTAVPSVDAEIAECTALVGGEQTRCWAELDQLLMEEVVPAVPLLVPWETRVFSERVASATVDQLTNQPALEGIALVEGSR